MGCMVKAFDKSNNFVGYFGCKYNEDGSMSKEVTLVDSITSALLYGDQSTVDLATYIKNTNGKYQDYRIELEWDGRGLNPADIEFEEVSEYGDHKMSNRYDYVIKAYNKCYEGREYFRDKYIDFCGKFHESNFVEINQASICSTQADADILFKKVEKDYPGTSITIIKKRYEQRAFRALNYIELDMLASAYIIASGCKNRLVEKTFVKEGSVRGIKISVRYINEEEKNNIKKDLEYFNDKLRYLWNANGNIGLVFLSRVISNENMISFVIFEDKSCTFREWAIKSYIYHDVFTYLYKTKDFYDVFPKDTFELNSLELKKVQYPEIVIENVEKSKDIIYTNKRKYNLPRHVCWDIKNTIAANKVWFCATLMKNGKRTSTAAKTVKKAMEYVVQNRLSEKFGH